MKRFFMILLKPLSFLPAIAILYVIFTFSGHSGVDSGALSHKVSRTVVTVGAKLLDKDLSDEQVEHYIERIHLPVRKAAHMAQYFFLAVAVSFPLYVYRLRGFWLLLVAGAICLAVAGLDEYRQSFVTGRVGSKQDVMIDGVGIFFGIMVVRIVCWTALAPSRLKARRAKRRNTK